jgi:integrase
MPALQIVSPTPSLPPSSPPAPPVEPPSTHRRKRKEPLHLDYGDIERLFHIINSARDRAIFRVAYHAGLRASEVGLIDLRDYNQKTERIAIHRLKGSNSGDHHCCREEARALHA